MVSYNIIRSLIWSFDGFFSRNSPKQPKNSPSIWSIHRMNLQNNYIIQIPNNSLPSMLNAKALLMYKTLLHIVNHFQLQILPVPIVLKYSRYPLNLHLIIVVLSRSKLRSLLPGDLASLLIPYFLHLLNFLFWHHSKQDENKQNFTWNWIDI